MTILAALESAALAAYPVRVFFAKTFVRGPLAGMTTEDSIPHVNEACADRWLAGVRRNIERGVLDYKISAVHVVVAS